MSDETQNNFFDKITELARQASEVKPLEADNRLVAVPEGMTLVSQESLLKPGIDETPAIDRFERIASPFAFVEFVKAYGTKDTVVFIDQKEGKANAILNYLPRDRSETTKPQRFDWQVGLSLRTSPVWEELTTLERAKPSASQTLSILKFLASISASFFEPPRTDPDVASFHDLDALNQLPYFYDAKVASSEDMLNLMQTRKAPKDSMIAHFALPIFEGAAPSDILILIAQHSSGLSISILDTEFAVEEAKTAAMTSMKMKLRTSFAVFDSDLSST